MKIILALALIVTLAVASEVIYDGGLGYGLSGSRGYGGLGGYSGYGGVESFRGGYDGLRSGLRGDSFRGGLGYGSAVESTPWVDYNGDGVVDWRDNFGAGGVRQRSGDFIRADWNGDGVIDSNDGWRALDSTPTASYGAWDPSFSTGYRGDLGYSGVRSSGAWEVPVERSYGYESGLGGLRSGYGSGYGPSYGSSYGSGLPSYGGSYGSSLSSGVWDGPVRGGDAWRGDSWRGDFGYEAPRVRSVGTTQARVSSAATPVRAASSATPVRAATTTTTT
jgi:hypothetical protein